MLNARPDNKRLVLTRPERASRVRSAAQHSRRTFYCTSGAGGTGGDWGQNGSASGQAILDGGVQYGANAGGAAGYAVRLSGGATLAWLGGNTAARVKGLAQ